ncbi:MAG TPA: dihydrodipicolinate synthase family protein [Candidatus Limnocylindrales bacterium]
MAFEGVRPVLPVPFGQPPDEAVCAPELAALTQRMVGLGVDGLVILGLASEAGTLREAERDEVLATTADAVAGRIPLVVGLDGATAVAVDRARRAARLGAAGLMVLPPAAARSTELLIAHVWAIADAADLPVLIQDSPQVTGLTLSVEAAAALGRHPLVRSVKSEIPGAGPKTTALVDAGLEVVAGWGGLHYLDAIRRGASGCMPGSDLGPAILAIDRLARSGDPGGAEVLYRQILPLLACEAASLDLLVLGAKRLLRRQRLFSSDRMRAPAAELDAVEAAAFDRCFEELEEAHVAGFQGRPT